MEQTPQPGDESIVSNQPAQSTEALEEVSATSDRAATGTVEPIAVDRFAMLPENVRKEVEKRLESIDREFDSSTIPNEYKLLPDLVRGVFGGTTSMIYAGLTAQMHIGLKRDIKKDKHLTPEEKSEKLDILQKFSSVGQSLIKFAEVENLSPEQVCEKNALQMTDNILGDILLNSAFDMAEARRRVELGKARSLLDAASDMRKEGEKQELELYAASNFQQFPLPYSPENYPETSSQFHHPDQDFSALPPDHPYYQEPGKNYVQRAIAATKNYYNPVVVSRNLKIFETAFDSEGKAMNVAPLDVELRDPKDADLDNLVPGDVVPIKIFGDEYLTYIDSDGRQRFVGKDGYRQNFVLSEINWRKSMDIEDKVEKAKKIIADKVAYGWTVDAVQLNIDQALYDFERNRDQDAPDAETYEEAYDFPPELPLTEDGEIFDNPLDRR